MPSHKQKTLPPLRTTSYKSTKKSQVEPAIMNTSFSEPDFFKHKVNKLHIENGIIYTFRDEINAFEVEEYLKDKIHKYITGTRFIIFCGFHTSDDGKLAGSDLNLVDHYQAMFDRLNEDWLVGWRFLSRLCGCPPISYRTQVGRRGAAFLEYSSFPSCCLSHPCVQKKNKCCKN